MERIAVKDPACTCPWAILHEQAPAQRLRTAHDCPIHAAAAVAAISAAMFCTVPIAVLPASGHPQPIDPQSQYICGLGLPCPTHHDGHIVVEDLGGLAHG